MRDTSSTAELKGLEGTINLNTSLTPFQSAPQRELPLRALLMGASKDGNSTITNFGTSGGGSVLIQNILNKKTAANGHDYANYPSDDDTVDGKRYCFPGEIVEIEGIADGGEASEALVRELLPLITTRSNVFRVYAIGQAISQTSSGEITVRSERKTISLLEVNNTTAKVVYQQNWEE